MSLFERLLYERVARVYVYADGVIMYGFFCCLQLTRMSRQEVEKIGIKLLMQSLRKTTNTQ